MKDPNSFTLYENAAAIESEAIFLNGEYMFDENNEIEIGDSERIVGIKLEILQIMYGIQVNRSGASYKVIKVDLDKVKDKLDIK